MALKSSYSTTRSFSYPVEILLNYGEVTCTFEVPADQYEVGSAYSEGPIRDIVRDIARDYIQNFDFYDQFCRRLKLTLCMPDVEYYNQPSNEMKYRITFKYFGASCDRERQNIVRQVDNISFEYAFVRILRSGSFVLRNGILYYKNPGSDFVTGLKLLFAPASIFLNELYYSAPIKLKLRGLIAMFIVPIIALIGLLFSPWCTNYCNFLIADLDCWVNGFDKNILSSSSCETRSSERSFVPMHLRPYLFINKQRISSYKTMQYIMLSKHEGSSDFALNSLVTRYRTRGVLH